MGFWNSNLRKAKKAHTCEYCGKTISVGESYFRETGVFEGDFNDYCLCYRCHEVLPYFKAELSYELGNFFDDLCESELTCCPNCDKYNSHNHHFSSDRSSLTMECIECGKVFTIDLSLEAITKFFTTPPDCSICKNRHLCQNYPCFCINYNRFRPEVPVR